MILQALDVSMAWKEICALSLISITIMLALPTVSASSDSFSDLKSSISGFDDPRMGTEDLAFYLASHGFDATPNGGFVEVHLGGHTCKLTPNGSAPGLASIAA
jgi:hypothetical protein